MRPTILVRQFANRSSTACLGQNIAQLEMLHAVARFFKAFPNVELAPSVTPESTMPLDYFVIKMKNNSLEVVLK